MKKSAMSLMLLVSSIASARDVVVTVPNKMIKEDKIEVNFDGTITITNPQVYVASTFAAIYYLAESKYREDGGVAVCSLWGLGGIVQQQIGQYFSVKPSDEVVKNLVVAHLYVDGSLSQFFQGGSQYSEWILERVTCKAK